MADPVLFQQTIDLLSGRTHRTSLFCRQGAPLEEATTTAVVLHFAAARGEMEVPEIAGEPAVAKVFRQIMQEAGRDCVPVRELMERTAERLGGGWDPTRHSQELAGWIYQAARFGGVELRSEAQVIPPANLEKPGLSRLNHHFASNGLPVVDSLHATCHFPAGHDRLLAAMDGTRSSGELQARAGEEFPELDFPRWLSHLADRGVLTP
jgi:hypothetical protein